MPIQTMELRDSAESDAGPESYQHGADPALRLSDQGLWFFVVEPKAEDTQPPPNTTLTLHATAKIAAEISIATGASEADCKRQNLFSPHKFESHSTYRCNRYRFG